MVNTIPGASRGGSAPGSPGRRRKLGASWLSRPTPCPSPWGMEKPREAKSSFTAAAISVVASPGTKRYLESAGIEGIHEVKKIASGEPNVLNLLDSGTIKLVINTPSGRGGQLDEAKIRRRAISINIPCITTIPAARAAISGIRALKSRDFKVRALQDYFPRG